MDLGLDGRRAIVTGGGKGIGLALVRGLIDEGATVVVGDIVVTPELDATAAIPVEVDLSTPAGATELTTTALDRLGGVDLLVNGIGGTSTENMRKGIVNDLVTMPDDAWQRTFDINFYSALRVTRGVLPSLVENQGTVVNISSSGARLVGRASSGSFDYHVAKAALNSLTKVIAEEYGPEGVRALTVSPGPVATDVWTHPEGFHPTRAREQGIPLDEYTRQLMVKTGASTGRISTPEEVARLILFLLSPNNLNGSEHFVDGGIVKNL